MKNQQQKYAVFIIFACVIMLGVFLYFVVYQKYEKNEHYKELYIEFKKPNSTYEIGTKLEPISFIKKTNASEIIYPDLSATTAGEHPFIYLAFDKKGNQKEFILLLTFIQKSNPIIELTTTKVEITEGDDINLTTYIKRAYDTEIGNELKVTIKKPKNFKKIGTHEIIYQVVSDTGKKKNAILRLTVNEKKQIEQIPKPPINEAVQPPKTPETSNPYHPPTPHNKPLIKNYLFSDGYTIETAPAACQSDLIGSGRPGQCIYLKGDDGLYTGMQLLLN